MQIVKRVSRMREVASECRKKGETVGLVPTMGALHGLLKVKMFCL